MKSLTICSSAAFYEEVMRFKDIFEAKGIHTLVPENAETMRAKQDFDISHYKTWYENDADYVEKTRLMRGHFDKVAEGDVTLVVNNEKHGVENYIGGKALMEMSLAFYLNKPIYLLNDIPEDSSFVEEIKGMKVISLHGDIDPLIRALTEGN